MTRHLGLSCAASLAVAAIPGGALESQSLTPAQAIDAATLPLPPQLRAGATVIAPDAGWTGATLRVGTNPMVCKEDPPGDDRLDVRCYHRLWVPFLQEAARLRSSGISRAESDHQIDEEIRGGRLNVPPFPVAGYRVHGPIADYDPVTGHLGPRLDRWQSLHMPYATVADVGIDTVETGIEPFMMSTGTWWSHVMIIQRPFVNP